MKREMNRYMTVGYILALAIEVINLGLLQGDWWSLMIVVIMYHGIAIFISYRLYIRKINKVVHYLIFGVVGIIAELFMYQGVQYSGTIFNSFIVAIGTFGHWATVAFAPRMLLDSSFSIKNRKSFLNAYMFGILCIYAVGYFSGINFLSVMLYGRVILYASLGYWLFRYFQI